jgi:hypothetical protein
MRMSMFRVLGQRQQRAVRRVDQQVVDQHAHLHAALGRTQQRLGREDADVVGAPDEVLHLDRLARLLDHPGAREQRFDAGFQHVHAGLAGIRGDLRFDESARLVVGGRSGRHADEHQRPQPAAHAAEEVAAHATTARCRTAQA